MLNSIVRTHFSVFRRIFALFLAFLVVTALFAQVQQADLAEKIIRFHVLANSDSPTDQALKLAVRDQVVAQVETLLTPAQSPQEAASLLQGNLEGLAETARNTLSELGCGDDVQVKLEETWFPPRTYGDYSLPAGRYQALRVIIGAGEGHNWWCVVFPSLTQGAVTEEALQTAHLTTTESALLTEDSPLVVKFKAAEVLYRLWERAFS
jgi:stage II sporulation protein R